MDQFHQLAPKLWRHTKNLTGDPVFDESIARCTNRDMKAKLWQHLGGMGESYGPKTAYRGYSSSAGDD
jgi:hypothetical protein